MFKPTPPEQLRQRLLAVPLEELRGSDIEYFQEADSHLQLALKCKASDERAFHCLCAEAHIAAMEAGRELVRDMVHSGILVLQH